MSTWTADDGSTIYFEMFNNKEGVGPPLLLLPGLLGTISSQWRNFLKPLSSDYRVILMDLRGHGRSENNAAGLNANRMLQDVIGLLDYLQITAVHIAGYSLGGYIGLMMAATSPRRVSSLLIHATKFYWTPESVAKMQRQLDPDLMAEKVPTYADQLVQEHGARQWRELVREAAALITDIAQTGLREKNLENIQCPVLVSVGERDELVPLMEVQRLSRMLPHGELLVLPGVHHPYPTLQLIPLLPMMQHFFKQG
ncbi:MAG: alpha/beta hydrolase [Anaerolineales bacterium]|nr:alpha/beta hydrolase [Anaerolineales bacterium]